MRVHLPTDKQETNIQSHALQKQSQPTQALSGHLLRCDVKPISSSGFTPHKSDMSAKIKQDYFSICFTANNFEDSQYGRKPKRFKKETFLFH